MLFRVHDMRDCLEEQRESDMSGLKEGWGKWGPVSSHATADYYEHAAVDRSTDFLRECKCTATVAPPMCVSTLLWASAPV